MGKSESLSQPSKSLSQPSRIARFRPRGKRALLIIAALAVVAAACGSDDPLTRGTDPTDPDPQGSDPGNGGSIVDMTPGGSGIRLTSAMSSFGSCDALLDHIQTTAVEQVGPYGLDSGGWHEPGRWPRELDDEAVELQTATADSASSGPVSGVDFSGTNIQEIDVDEADLVKTDGKRVLVLANRQLVVIDAERRVITGTLNLGNDGWTDHDAEMFLHGDDLLIVSRTHQGEAGDLQLLDDLGSGRDLTLIRRVRVDGGDPSMVSGVVVEGSYVSSRSIEGVARVIVRSRPENKIAFVRPANDSAIAKATQINREAVLETELSDWLPATVRFDNGGFAQQSEPLLDCEQVHAPTEFAGFGVLSVLSIPIDGEIDTATTTAVLAPGNMVYASGESVYVTTPAWIDPATLPDDPEARRQARENRETSIHRFELSTDSASYTASGSVPGDLHNQFSMSEWDDHLRVVTTTGDPWDRSSETFLRILGEHDGALVEVGSVGDMGKGEDVQSVRLVGDVGYVVTFEQIDPFYTLDLSDHTNPRVVGELKIPGFSSYLHPIGNGRVLGVGSDADDIGRVTGSKVSIFDVTDPADPREVAIWALEDGTSEIAWDHRAFNWWEPEQMAIIPLQYSRDFGRDHWAGAVILQVDGNELVETGRFDHDTSDTGVFGATDCTDVTAEDIGFSDDNNTRSLLEYISSDDNRVIICGPGERLQISGYDCYQDEFLRELAEITGMDLDEDETLGACWVGEKAMPVIARTMVIDRDELWSISGRWGLYPNEPARVQVNDLAGLARLDAIEIY